MIINKATSDSVLVSALRLFDGDNKTIGGVSEFNTDTMEGTLSAGGTVTATSFEFHISGPEVGDSLVPLLEAEPNGEDLLFHIKVKPTGRPKKAMDDADTAPTERLIQQAMGAVYLVKCTNCSTTFVLFEGGDQFWSVEKANASDKLMTATLLDSDGLVCDNCAEPVVVERY